MNENKRINIAIDGPAGSGKGTTAKLLAQKISYKYFDSGSIYRAIAYYFDKNGISPQEATKEKLEGIKDITFNENGNIILNGENIEDCIRTPKINEIVSDYAKKLFVRKFHYEKSKNMIKQKGIVAEGRDVSSVLMPDSELKIYLDCNVEERARRRVLQYKEKGIKADYNKVLEEIKKRDYIDTTRKHSPLTKVDDAILIDNSNLTIDEQVEKIYRLYLRKSLY